MSVNPPPPGATSETVASPPPTNTRPLPPLLLDSPLLEALLLDSPLLEALLLAAVLLVTPVDAVLLVVSPPAPLDEPLVGSATEPQATSHAPASTTKAPSDAARLADRRRLRSRWTTGLFICAFLGGPPLGLSRPGRATRPTVSPRRRIHALTGANPAKVPEIRRRHHRYFYQDLARARWPVARTIDHLGYPLDRTPRSSASRRDRPHPGRSDDD
jgi:hypothetical protein